MLVRFAAIAVSLCSLGGAFAADTLEMAGSSTVANAFVLDSKAQAEKELGITISVRAGGSSAGIKEAVAGKVPLALSSRELKDDETAQGLVATLVAHDALAIVANAVNPVADLSADQVKGIFSGTITNWKDVGGGDQKIVVVIGAKTSGTRESFLDQVLGKDGAFGSAAIEVPDIPDQIAKVGQLKGSITYASPSQVDAKTKLVSVGGVAPSAEAVQKKAYPFARGLFLISKGEPQGAAKAYLDWVLGAAGQAAVAKRCVPVK
jgi:phosphate transport system substrate-binding protein